MIVDLGLARSCKGPLKHYAGTIGYMAPEINVGQHDLRKADVFAFGIVLFQAVTTDRRVRQFTNKEGSVAVEEKKTLYDDMMENVLNGRHRKHFSDAFRDLMKGMLALSEDERMDMQAVLSPPWWTSV